MSSFLHRKASYRTNCYNKNAFNRRFFVYLTCLLLSRPLFPALADSDHACQIKRADARVRIEHVIDGDTLVLADDERIRLIGRDSPESGYYGNPSQAGAIDAMNFVRELLKKEQTLSIRYGTEKQDRHGRTLAHVFLQDGRNLQALILARGYATPLNIPPNINFSDCYEEKANQARQNRLGLWALAQYRAIPADSLTEDQTGYRIIYGKISHNTYRRGYTWLNFGQHLAIKINNDELRYFPGLNITNLVGKKVQVRGKVYLRNRQLRMHVRHLHDLQILRY
jgi:endonuclease YncB( thermonuclease family)